MPRPRKKPGLEDLPEERDIPIFTEPGQDGQDEPQPPKRKRKKPAPPEPHYEAPPAAPIALDPDQILADEKGPSENDILKSLFVGAFARYNARQKDSKASRGVEAVGEVVSRIQEGQPLQAMQEYLASILGEQQAKTLLLQATMYNHQMERVALHWDMRWRLERDLWQDLREQKLSSMEKLSLLKLACQEAEKAAVYINDHSHGYSPIQEVEQVVERASKPAVDKDRAAQRKELEGTTPQGREIIRRLTSKAKAAADKIATDKAKENATGNT